MNKTSELSASFIDFRARADERILALDRKMDALGLSLDEKISSVQQELRDLKDQIQALPRSNSTRPILYSGGSAAGAVAIIELLKYISQFLHW